MSSILNPVAPAQAATPTPDTAVAPATTSGVTNVNEIARDPRTGEPIFPAQDELAVEVQNVLKNAGVPESPGLIDSIGKFLKDSLIPIGPAATVLGNPDYKDLISAGVNANELRGVIIGESKGYPKAQNRGSKAAGLFQFTPTAAKELGTTVTEILNMSPKEQADLYLKYLNRWGWKPGVPLGLMQAAPSLARNWNNRSRDDVVYRKDSKAWKVNPGWRPKDGGDITIGSIENYYASKAPGKPKSPPIPPERP